MPSKIKPSIHSCLICLTLLCLSAVCGAGPNIYPDPGFEASGASGEARTGQKAGYLKVDAKNHWAAIGGRLEVEPFAKYWVSAWVKGKVGEGQFFAPYCYEWDNFEWNFVSSSPIRTPDDWTKTEATFVSPHATMYVHPLAYMNAADSEAWVDDIVVEKIAGPAEAMKELASKAAPTDADRQILARWYLRRGHPEKARRLMLEASGEARADIACLLAQNTRSLARRRPYILEMIVSGGPGYNDGIKRLDEITKDLNESEKLRLCERAVSMKPGMAAARSFCRVLDAARESLGVPLTFAESSRRIKALRNSASRVSASLPPGSEAEKEVQAAMHALESTEKEIEARKTSLGRCQVFIGEKLVRPDSHAIVVPDKATAQEAHAARELAYHLELITGQALPILSESKADGKTALLVGNCRQSQKLDPALDLKSLGTEGIYLKSVGPSLILAGNRRGVLYAAYTFLEDYLGCRWFAPDCATWPMSGAIRVPQIGRRYLPPLEYRGTDYPRSLAADYSARNRYNGGNHRPDEPRGGHIGVLSLAHTFDALVPPEKYFATHPEYYSEIDGKRFGPQYTQLCLTNPDVLKIAIAGVKQWIKDHPDKTIFSVSQNDWFNFCTCANCKAVAEEEGSQAGPVLRFVNAVADAVREEHPEVAIETLAYQYTRKPPKIAKPRSNVIICLCSIECCFIHPLGSDEFNKTFVDDIRGWNRICNRLYIWDYVINYAHSISPFPNLYVLKPNIEFFIQNGVKGIYEEACYYTRGSELQELRAYIMTKALWDPSCDTDRAIDEFCAAYYGAAGQYVREYINLIHREAQKDSKTHVTIYTHPKAHVSTEMLGQAEAVFDRAEEAVKGDPALLHRVQVARLPVIYARIALAAATREGKPTQAEADTILSLADRFEKIARAEGVTMIREGGPDASLDAWLAAVRSAAQ
ncbi:MAG: DUF4838 domain-containing protein [Armatimonadetes bacterium]|nr:DUF4838 domain-containing protein [Armatimonadota bacterium]